MEATSSEEAREYLQKKSSTKQVLDHDRYSVEHVA
jgi:hypothetical protein